MATLPDWIVEAREKDRDLAGYAGDPDDEKACADYDFRRAMLWEEHGTDLIRKVELQAGTIERLNKQLRDLFEYAQRVSQFWNCMDAKVCGVPARVRNLQMAVDRTRIALESKGTTDA